MEHSTTEPTPEEDSKPGDPGSGASVSAQAADCASVPDGQAGDVDSAHSKVRLSEERIPAFAEPKGDSTAAESRESPVGGGAGDDLPVDDTIGDFDTLPPGDTVPSDSLERWQDGQQVAGRFRIQRFLGQGGMGKVYLAQDEMLGRAVALKRIPPEIIFDGDARDDLRHEANRLLDLAHENIVRIHTYYDGPTWPFIAMEMLQGPTLKKLLYQRRQHRSNSSEKRALFSADELRCIAHQVAKGLQYAHAKGIVHRDLKPSNLMLVEPPHGELSDADTIKITDFGISRVVADSTLRQTGKHSGTLPYMSPEQYRGEVCTPQSDVYSLGCSLYELATGTPPFRTGDIGYQVMHVMPKAPLGLPRPMARAILRAMAKKPHQRFANVEEFLAALEGRAGPLRRGRLRVFGSVAGVTATLVTVLVLAWALTSFLRTESTTTRSAAVGPAFPPSVPAPTRLAETDLTQYGQDLRLHLEQHIPKFIGPALSESTWSEDGLAFSVPLFENTNRRGLPIDRLYFEYYPEGEGYDEPPRIWVEARDLDAASTFSLQGLRDGDYVLRAYAMIAAESKELFRSPLRFRVDTQPPQVELRPVAMEDFVDTESAGDDVDSFTTFHETVRLWVTTSSADEIASASYRIVYGKTRPWRTLEEPYELNLIESPGGITSYDVKVEDHAGNSSPPRRLRVRRLDLRLEKFRLAAPVVGNLARLDGVLSVEGDQLPALRYLVNGEVVEPLEHSHQVPEQAFAPPTVRRTDDGDSEEVTRTMRRMLLTATLRLPRASGNRIDLKYVWSGGELQPFARSLPIYSIDMRPPRILSLNVPLNATFRTTNPQLRLVGTLAPYFEGLGILVDTQGREATEIRPIPSGQDGEADFEHTVELWPETNTIELIYRYEGQNLTPSAGESTVLTVDCDQIPPTLGAPIHFDPVEPWLYITIQPSESLDKLRIQVGEDDTGVWQEVEAIPGGLLYRHITTIPKVPTRFRVEMTDLAGLRGEAGETFPQRYNVEIAGDPSSEGTATATELTPTAGGRDLNEPVPAVRSSGTGAVTLRAAFLREMGMDFRPFGSERFEMAVTEVPERAWFEFLRVVDPEAPTEAGRLSFPMVLADYDPALLAKFVRWFEQKADDGYHYVIPTVQQWQAAFVGDDHPAQNLSQIRSWFRGTRADGKQFDIHPSVRYGWNQVKRIGSRTENATPTGLLDMESNVQEVVRGGDFYYVLGAHNAARESELIERYCLRPRAFTDVPSSLSGGLTGFRLCRRPATTPDE